MSCFLCSWCDGPICAALSIRTGSLERSVRQGQGVAALRSGGLWTVVSCLRHSHVSVLEALCTTPLEGRSVCARQFGRARKKAWGGNFNFDLVRHRIEFRFFSRVKLLSSSSFKSIPLSHHSTAPLAFLLHFHLLLSWEGYSNTYSARITSPPVWKIVESEAES